MINQIDTRLWHNLNGLLRSIIAHGGLFNLCDIYIVNEYPKSGGTWLGQMLSSALEVPFPRNRLPIIGDSLLHGHFIYKWNINKMVILWRDGRDVIVSQYFHINRLSKQYSGHKGRMGRILGFTDVDDIHNNLPKFIEYMFDASKHRHHTWPEFVDYWVSTNNTVETKYEILRENTAYELRRILVQLTGKSFEDRVLEDIVEKYSFENQTGRKPGEERNSNFLRKGIIGDWKNYFNAESAEIFHHFAGKQLIKLEYEEDNNWVSDC